MTFPMKGHTRVALEGALTGRGVQMTGAGRRLLVATTVIAFLSGTTIGVMSHILWKLAHPLIALAILLWPGTTQVVTQTKV